ncbi:MAG: transporter [Erysipelotrichaceae bacterium]|nr:transporter [Erysipelotrichaceae bacterium]
MFPILVLNLILSATIDMTQIKIIAYVFVAYMIALVYGKIVAPLASKKYVKFSPYLLTVVEGENVALPLYLSIVGTSSNTVIYDIAGTVTCFIIFPILIAKESSSATSTKELVKSIFSNSFVIAVIIGLALNLTGVYSYLLASPLGDTITATFSQVTTPIVSMILFCLGYDLNIDKNTLGPILKLIGMKLVAGVAIIVGFFILFPDLMADKTYMMAPILYFTAPTGFGLMPVIEPLYENEDDGAFTSAFVLLFIIVSLIVYTLVVLFIA